CVTPLLENMAGILPIELGDQHGAGANEASALIQAAQPVLVAETLGKVHIDAAETERHGVDAGCGPGCRPHAEAAIEQGVIVPEAKVNPAPFRPALGVALDPHVVRLALRPAAVSKFGPPAVVVG